MRPRKLEGLDDFPSYGHHDRWSAVACGVQSETVRAIAAAVTGWAELLGVTVERWLEVYEPHIEAKRGEAPNTITFTVSARLRGIEEVPLPFSEEVVVGMSGPSVAPTIATTPEQVRELFGYPVPPLDEPQRPFRPVSVGYEPTADRVCVRCGARASGLTSLTVDGRSYCDPDCVNADARRPLYVGDGYPRVRRAEDAAGTYLPTEDPE